MKDSSKKKKTRKKSSPRRKTELRYIGHYLDQYAYATELPLLSLQTLRVHKKRTRYWSKEFDRIKRKIVSDKTLSLSEKSWIFSQISSHADRVSEHYSSRVPRVYPRDYHDKK